MWQKIKAWLKRHRKGVIIATVLSITSTVVILLINGKKVKIPITELTDQVSSEISAATPEVTKATEAVTLEVDGIVKTFPRSQFIRQLHEGWNASPAKIAQAAAMKIHLNPGETIVNATEVTMSAV